VETVFWPAPERLRRELQEVIAKRGAVTPDELRDADHKLARAFSKWQRDDRHVARKVSYIFFVGALGFGVLISVIWTLCTGTPLGLRVCGLSLVRRKNGHAAGRLRAVIRLVVAWIPAFSTLMLLGLAPALDAGTAMIASLLGLNLVVFAVALLIAVRRPDRAIADQLCGTAIVPC
jgi:hypothetical protein